MVQPQGPALEADDIDDSDSALGDDIVTSTTSLHPSALKYREENGRTYHAYKEGKYVAPNDDLENDRLDLQHYLFSLTFGGKLFTCPVDAKRIHRVLDIGTGTGIWAIDFADEHPGAQIVGVDLSPIQPRFVPPNVEFLIDDLEEPWIFKHKFDFIYCRMMTASFSDWPRIFEQAFKNLNPEGYIELVDISFPLISDDDSIPPDSALKKWSDLQMEACTKAGRPINSAESYKSQLEAAGFIDVAEVKYRWPINSWPKDRKFKILGIWNLENVKPSLEGFSMALYTRILGWTKEEVDDFLDDVRKDLVDRRIHAYWPIYVVYGRRPV